MTETTAPTRRVQSVGVDFDGVIHRYSKGWQDGSIYDEPMPGAVEGLRALLARYAVFVFTTRSVHQVAEWLVPLGFGVRIDGDPDSPEFWNARDILFVTNRKLAAVAYIDDRAVRFHNWGQALADVELGHAGARLLTVDGSCRNRSCNKATYRMIGSCYNCHTKPIVMVFSVGHDVYALTCPVCGADKVVASRLATDEESQAAGDA